MHKQLFPRSPSHEVTVVTYSGSSGPHADPSNHLGERRLPGLQSPAVEPMLQPPAGGAHSGGKGSTPDRGSVS